MLYPLYSIPCPLSPDSLLVSQERWIDELQSYGRFRNLPAGESYDRLTYLLGTSLPAYFGRPERETAAKRRWTSRHLLPDPSGLDPETRRKYIRFIRAARAANLLPPEFSSPSAS